MSSSEMLFLSLLTAHLLADFLLQTRHDVEQKTRPWVFAKHIALVTGLSWFLAGDWSNWIIPLVIGATHGLIDAAKLFGVRRGWRTGRLFFWDQIAHLAVIVALVVLPSTVACENSFHLAWGELYPTLLLLISGLVSAVRLGGIVIGMATAQWLDQVNAVAAGGGENAQEADPMRVGLRDGGRIIGQLERGLIFFFVLIGQPEAVAFLIAAKSVFRFGELTRSRKEAEYILIGTLMSFAWGLVVAWLTAFLLAAGVP